MPASFLAPGQLVRVYESSSDGCDREFIIRRGVSKWYSVCADNAALILWDANPLDLRAAEFKTKVDIAAVLSNERRLRFQALCNVSHTSWREGDPALGREHQ